MKSKKQRDPDAPARGRPRKDGLIPGSPEAVVADMAAERYAERKRRKEASKSSGDEWRAAERYAERKRRKEASKSSGDEWIRRRASRVGMNEFKEKNCIKTWIILLRRRLLHSIYQEEDGSIESYY
jgi:hypothetical protein